MSARGIPTRKLCKGAARRRNWSVWSPAPGLPIAAEWEAEGGWCDAGGTLPPPTQHDHNNPNPSDECLLEPGQLLQGGRTFARDIQIEDNVFVAPQADPFGRPWRNNHLHLGGVDGLTLRNNHLARPGGYDAEASSADIVLYSNKEVAVGGNTCAIAEGAVPCVLKNASTCGSVSKC